jgi:hypothetical protein
MLDSRPDLGTYDLKGALTIGPSHNYYVGRAEADITKWIKLDDAWPVRFDADLPQF